MAVAMLLSKTKAYLPCTNRPSKAISASLALFHLLLLSRLYAFYVTTEAYVPLKYCRLMYCSHTTVHMGKPLTVDSAAHDCPLA